MASRPAHTSIDPLQSLVLGFAGAAKPIPLKSTHFAVILDGGLAVVTTRRRFHNAEAASIEATITFPVPVHATLFGLNARIGERVLEARSRRKDEARDDYENAIERGQTSVLHEEVLRGVHMLSVAHVPPGAEIEVSASWAMVLTNVSGRAHLRIPVTVGDIYGRSALPDSDDLVHADIPHTGTLTVTCRDGTVRSPGRELAHECPIALDAPIDLEVTGWTPKDLRGRAADGREVVLRIEPAAGGDAPLNVAILVDRSGSMADLCTIDHHGLSKHRAVIKGLQRSARQLRNTDIVELWEFNEAVGCIGWTDAADRAQELRHLLRHLSPPASGTEIGVALMALLRDSAAEDVLLITDGKSHALPVHYLASFGVRISVVLVGEDSLEANVGHLAALTGGDIHVTTGDDLTTVIEQAVRSLRGPRQSAGSERLAPPAKPLSCSALRAGMEISARWGAPAPAGEPTPETRAIAAVATSLVLATLRVDAATELAAAEGLVTHLTSLVLVDEDGATQDAIPATRKIPLATPRTSRAMRALPPRDEGIARAFMAGRRGFRLRPWSFGGGLEDDGRFAFGHGVRKQNLRTIALRIDWDSVPHPLLVDHLASLGPKAFRLIAEAAGRPDLIAVARKLAMEPALLVVGLLARVAERSSRSAARAARALLRRVPADEVKALALCLGLEPIVSFLDT